MGSYKFCVRALFLEAVVFVACGFVIGLAWRDWRAVVASQMLLLACETTGYAIEQWLHKRRSVEGARW